MYISLGPFTSNVAGNLKAALFISFLVQD